MTLAVIIALFAGFVGVGVYGITHPPAQRGPLATAGAHAPKRVSPSNPARLRALIHTGEAVAYAKAVAETLFSWNTASGLIPEDYQSVVSEDADPSGGETSGLVNDLAAYYPTDAQWQLLRKYDTAQTLTIQRVYIPAAWGQAVASDPSAVKPGTVAVTVDGIRHRTGTWYGTGTATSAPVSFTIFMACQPTFPRCHVLRLSGVNTPLK